MNEFGDIPPYERCPLCPPDTVWINWVPNTNKKYAVMTNGLIISYCRKKPFAMKTGGKHDYARVRFGTNANPIVAHKVIANVFPDKIPNWNGTKIDWSLYEIDHHDKNKKHNCVSNMRVVVKGSQVKLTYTKGERKLKLTPEIIAEIKHQRSMGVPVRDLAAKYGVSTSRIYQVTRSLAATRTKDYW